MIKLRSQLIEIMPTNRCRRVRKRSPLFCRGHNIQKHGGDDVVFGLVVNEHSMTDSTATVMPDPDDFTFLSEHRLQAYNDEVADCTLICLRWDGAEPIAR